MEFSIVEGDRRKAERGLKGICPLCGEETTPKCGNIRIHHWAHKRGKNCDPWWEPETDWHREWKRIFPERCREVTVTSIRGEKHRADVKTDCGRVIEFQHSPISFAAREARETFYENMAWVINGLRVKREKKRFDLQLSHARVLQNSPLKLRIPIGNCVLIRTWVNSKVGVYIDFGDTLFSDIRFNFSIPALWRLFPGHQESHVELAPVWQAEFIDAALNGGSINGINAPNIAISRDREDAEPELNRIGQLPKTVDISPKYRRQKSESDLEYSLRVRGLDGDG
ncbi:MAG: competence protein CoiA family protein [Rhodospirillales bacterium]